ncbi:MAG: hypothetical protein IPN17_27135 [Deltaproteobacteria bacterium]|jgi:hypothetical protein|nr:hypothetical protein [Deltaproteobacteria bacterium]MBK8695839.1 hypothetical protein [Deltaproteobacteria bacterium]MBP6832128.1 hypothetical protein [Deltaproteobacteria bacterium]
MGFRRLLDRLRPLAQRLKARAPTSDAAEGVSGFSDGFDARPWLSRLDPASAQLFCAVFEAGFLIAQADGRFDRAERSHMRQALLALSDEGILADDVDAMLSGFTASLSRDGAAARCEAVGRLLRAHDVGEAGVYLAAGIACASDGLSQVELKTLDTLARHAGLGFERLSALVEAIRADLATPD